MTVFGNLVHGISGNEVNSLLQSPGKLGCLTNRVAGDNSIIDKLFTRSIDAKEEGLRFALAFTGNGVISTGKNYTTPNQFITPF